jgi:hypothetical protein
VTHEEVFERLKAWAKIFGYPVHEAVFAEGCRPEWLEEGTRGFLQRERINLPGWIWLKLGLPSEERAEVLGHEVGHLAIHVLKGEPYESEYYDRLTHEPTADLLGRCFVAIIQEDFENPLFDRGGVRKSVKEFLEILKGKIERTGRNLFMMEIAYHQWKKEVEGSGKQEAARMAEWDGGSKFSDEGPC